MLIGERREVGLLVREREREREREEGRLEC